MTQDTVKDWSPAQYKALFTADGKQFGLPKYHGGLALYFNKDAFDAAGVEYPTYEWTHDDYLEAMRKLTVRVGDTTTRWGSMFDVSWERIQMHVNGWGGIMSIPMTPGAARWQRPLRWKRWNGCALACGMTR